MATLTLSLQKTHELTFHVESPILNKTTASASAKTTTSKNDSSFWKISLARSGSSLSVKVEWYRPSYHTSHEPDGDGYHFMHIIPHSNREDIATTSIEFPRQQGSVSVSGLIHASKVVSRDKYRFDIVLSPREDLEHRSTPKSLLTTMSTRGDTLLSLLKDVHSVDTCFIFTSDKTYPKAGLWAHKAILSKHKVFEQLILEATKALGITQELQLVKRPFLDAVQASAGSGSATSSSSSSTKKETSDMQQILTIQVDKFSLTTMCSILRYIYTGEVQLSITPNQFAISKAESALVLYDSQGKTRESIQWDPLGADSSWKLKEVTWPELLLAAEFYGIGELRALCENETVETLDESNVVDILFNVGYQSERIKNEAVGYIVKHLDVLFVGGRDPFESFRDHPACHDMLIEVFQVKATKKA